jgi:hypothetical protein
MDVSDSSDLEAYKDLERRGLPFRMEAAHRQG